MLKFKIEKCENGGPFKGLDNEGMEFETTQEMFMFICEVFDELECCHFTVDGFGDNCWPVSIW